MVDKRKSNSLSYRAAIPARPARRAGGIKLSLEKIISGGQTGVDRAALDFAIEHGLAHGGWCPQGRRAEDGEISASYALHETPESDYSQRTAWNVRDADATVIFTIGRRLTGGSALTHETARKLGKPCLHLSRDADGNSSPAKLIAFLRQHRVKVLNVAGPRLSTEPAARAFASQVLAAAWPRTSSSPAP